MATTDNAGYNTSNSLAAGLQSAAVYDPTQQSTPLQTSVAGTLNSQNNNVEGNPGASGLQDAAGAPTSGLLSTSSNNAAFPSWHSLLAGQNKSSTYTIAPYTNGPAPASTSTSVAPTGQTTTNTYTDYQNGGTATATSPVSAPVTTSNSLTAPNANIATKTNGLADITSVPNGYKTVSVRTSDGNFAYYTFDPTSGQYKYAATYDKNGQVVNGGQHYVDANGVGQVFTGLTDADRQSAVLQSLGAGQTFNTQDAGNQSGIVTQYNNGAIQAWQKANTAAAANAASTQLTTQTAGALAYMEANGGALPPANAPGMSGQAQYSPDALAAAQTQYATYLQTRQSEDANAALLGQYANKPIDTAAVDATSKSASDAFNSIGASQGGGADSGAGSRLAANTGAGIVGQGALNHQTAAAQSYYTNMQAFGQALTAQASTDATATETKLNSDIQNVQDVATKLEQNLSQLDTQTQLRVKGQLDQLQNQIAQYQYAMQHYKDNTALIHQLAIGVLALGGAIATVATGGIAAVGIAAGTAAAAAAGSKV